MGPQCASMADKDLVGTSETQVAPDQLVHQISIGARRVEQPDMISKSVAIGFEASKSGGALDLLLLNSRPSNQAIRPQNRSKKKLPQNHGGQRLGQRHANNAEGRSRGWRSEHGGATFAVRWSPISCGNVTPARRTHVAKQIALNAHLSDPRATGRRVLGKKRPGADHGLGTRARLTSAPSGTWATAAGPQRGPPSA